MIRLVINDKLTRLTFKIIELLLLLLLNSLYPIFDPLDTLGHFLRSVVNNWCKSVRFNPFLSFYFTCLPIVYHFVVSLIKFILIQFHIRLSNLILLNIINFYLFLLRIFFLLFLQSILLFQEPLIRFLLLA